MLRALPVLIIVGLAIYSFFDVLKTEDLLIRRGPKAMWLVLALVPVLGAALWFLLGRPVTGSEGYPPPRTINLKRQQKQVAPDDDPNFLRKLDQEAWLRKRQEARDKDKANDGTTSGPTASGSPSGSTAAGSTSGSTGKDRPGAARPSPVDGASDKTSDEAADDESSAKEKSPDEQDL